MVTRYSHFLLAILLLFAAQASAKVSLKSDRTVLHLNESLNVELIQENASGGNPDLSVLEKDFTVLSQSQSQQYNMINGRTSQKKVWALTLMPKRAGEIVIPSIQIGKEGSLPLHLVIKKAKQTSANNQTEQVFMQVSINPKDLAPNKAPNKVYVQQKLELVIKIFYRISLNNLALSDISIENVIMEKFGEDTQYTKTVKQHSYQVIERRYALYPQKSGLMTIPAIRFEAIVSSRANSGGNWPFFTQRGKPIYKQSDPININILPKPDHYTGKDWLPAESIQVVTEHSDLSNINIGDSITITDKIIAKGLSGSVLNEIPFKATKGIKIYPDQAKVDNQERQGILYGLREQKTALIPTRAGRFQLPARELIWWNIKADKMEKKIIPGLSFNVIPPEAEVISQPVEAVIEPTPPNIIRETKVTKPKEKSNEASNELTITNADNNQTNERETSSSELALTKEQLIKQLFNINNNIWFWIWCVSTILFIIVIILLIRRKPSKAAIIETEETEQQNSEDLLPKLIHAMKFDNPKETYDLFIKWMQQDIIKTQINNIDFSSQIPNSALKESFLDLESHLFSDNKKYDSWKAKPLYQALKKFIKNRNKQIPEDIKLIPELY